MSESPLPRLRKHPPGIYLPNAARERLGKDLRAHYENGATMAALGKLIGCSTGTVRRLLVAGGATIRKRGQYDRHTTRNPVTPCR